MVSQFPLGEKITALWRLGRPGNVALIIVAVILGAVLGLPLGACPRAALGPLLWQVLAAAAALGLTAAGGYAVNDLCDLEMDRVNRPDRPLPSGRITPRGAVIYTSVVWIVSLGLSWFGPAAGWPVVPFCLLLSFVYAMWLKPTGLPGNLVVALMTSLALAYGSTAVWGLDRVLPIAALAFLVNLARELYKDLEDLPGDIQAGARTLPARIGPEWTRLVASSIAFAVTPALVLFYLTDELHWVDAAALAVGLALPLLGWGIYGLARPAAVGKVQRGLKEMMLVGLLVLLIARLLYRWIAG